MENFWINSGVKTMEKQVYTTDDHSQIMVVLKNEHGSDMMMSVCDTTALAADAYDFVLKEIVDSDPASLYLHAVAVVGCEMATRGAPCVKH